MEPKPPRHPLVPQPSLRTEPALEALTDVNHPNPLKL